MEQQLEQTKKESEPIQVTRSLTGWNKLKSIVKASKEAEDIATANAKVVVKSQKIEDLLVIAQSKAIKDNKRNSTDENLRRLQEMKSKIAEDLDTFDIGAPWGGLITELLPLADKVLGIDADVIEDDELGRSGLVKRKSNDHKMILEVLEEQKSENRATNGGDLDEHTIDENIVVPDATFVGSTARLEVLQRLLKKTQGGQERTEK